MGQKKKPRRRSNRLLWVAIPSHRATTALIDLFHNQANAIAKRLKKPHLTEGTAPICPLCDTELSAGQHLQVIHRDGHEQINILEKAIKKRRQSCTFLGSTTYLVELEHLEAFYENYHQKNPCIAIGCRKCHSRYEKICSGAAKKTPVLAWWNRLNRAWTAV